MSGEQAEILNVFFNGMITMGHATAGLFFLRFWKQSRDRLFLLFAIAFWLLGMIRVMIAFVGESGEEQHLHWFRLAAYLLILAAIVDKNIRR
jgi:hypothetical protein